MTTSADPRRPEPPDRGWFWWCDDCQKKTRFVQLEDGTYQCQNCGGTV